MRKLAALMALAALTLFSPQPGFAQASDDLKALRNEIRALKEGQDAIQKELQELRRLLQARPAPSQAEVRQIVLTADGSPVMGDKRAKVTLFDSSDYQ